MRRRLFLLSIGAALISAAPVFAQTAQEQVIRQLKRQGYSRITVARTLLGRVRIVAQGPAGRREIVLNPASGAILRDYVDRSGGGNGGFQGQGGTVGRDRDDDDDDDNSGRGNRDDDDDDDDDDDNSGSGRDDDDDDDDDDDNSGSGGGGDSDDDDDD